MSDSGGRDWGGGTGVLEPETTPPGFGPERLLVLMEASLAEAGLRFLPDAREQVGAVLARDPDVFSDQAQAADLFRAAPDSFRRLDPPVSAYEAAVLQAGRLTEALWSGAVEEGERELSMGFVSNILSRICPLPPFC
ncbi:MAG TPA: hypothetical protein VKA30_10675 [Actinomycetota bacterium]|nr:hypothetical protein [Actinomycetota bacterium]